MEVPAQTKALIIEEMARPFADIFKISADYKVPIRIIRDWTEVQPVAASSREVNGGLGRPQLHPFIVSRTRAGTQWPEADGVKIALARESYDAGLVEIATGRDGDWLILYAIPRKVPHTTRRPYFAREEV